MITFVSGTLVEKHPTSAVLDVGGIGYELHIPTSSFEKLPEVGKPARLLAHFQVREDAHTLFGFVTEPERTLFRTLIGVSGVGPKLALAVLSAMPPADLRDHILEGDAGVLTRIPGVGKKTAERLVVELKDRLEKLDGLGAGGGIAAGTADGAAVRADARAALESLGFSRAEAEKRIRKSLRDHPGVASPEELIRLALKA